MMDYMRKNVVIKLVIAGVILPLIFAMIFSAENKDTFWGEYMLFMGAYLLSLMGYKPVSKRVFEKSYKWYWDVLLLVWFDMAVSGLFVMVISVI